MILTIKKYLTNNFTIFSFMTPLFGITFGIIIQGEKLTYNFILGAILILIGILFISSKTILKRLIQVKQAEKMILHQWTQDPKEAIAIQKQLASQIEKKDRLPTEINFIAGVDIGFEKENDTTITRAAVVVLSYPFLEVVDYALHREITRMPYIPGLLSFREVPAAIVAFKQLSQQPDLVMVDGQGIAHPRRLGVASHLGLWLDIPTIGIAKKRLCGKHPLVPEEKGSWVSLEDKGEVIGAVLRSKQKINPLFISIGHRICLGTALHWVNNCLTNYKLPEPTRQADRLASRRVNEKHIFKEWQIT